MHSGWPAGKRPVTASPAPGTLPPGIGAHLGSEASAWQAHGVATARSGSAQGRTSRTAVYLEVAPRRTFAGALDWPGWCRSGRTEEQALEALAAYAGRYRAVVAEAHVRFVARAAQSDFEIVERLQGSASTEFGAPGAIPAYDASAPDDKEAGRLIRLVAAAWRTFDAVVAGAPPTLRKGPRGGGRDRDAIVVHLLDAEGAYARQLGVRLKVPDAGDRAAVEAHRQAILRGLRSGGGDRPPAKGAWPVRYAARRIAWHALDHAWEIEDRIE
jgi:hypothetical protein